MNPVFEYLDPTCTVIQKKRIQIGFEKVCILRILLKYVEMKKKSQWIDSSKSQFKMQIFFFTFYGRFQLG